jgi:hypothetical protein
MTIDRRHLLLAGVAAAFAPALAPSAAFAASKLMVVYVSARNCPVCREWNAYDKDGFAARCAAKGVPFRTVDVKSFGNIRNEDEWPADLRPLLAQFDDRGGTPRFLLVEGGKIVGNVLGPLKWRDGAVPGAQG